jgi:hypothetical protein
VIEPFYRLGGLTALRRAGLRWQRLGTDYLVHWRIGQRKDHRMGEREGEDGVGGYVLGVFIQRGTFWRWRHSR